MRTWLAAFVAFTMGTLAIVLRTETEQQSGTQHEAVGITELREQISDLQRRLNDAEANAAQLTFSESSVPSTPAQNTARAVASVEPSPERPQPPNSEQQMARFEAHFYNLDTLRGKAEDFTLESKINSALADALEASSALKKSSIDRVICGNRLCRVEVTFPDANTLRVGEAQLHEQLVRVTSSHTAYIEPGSRHLLAYYAVDDMQLPEFPPNPG